MLPGAGHLAAGRRRLALVFGLPVLVALLALAIVVASMSIPRLAAEIVSALGLILLLQAVVLVWRLLAVATGLSAVGWRQPRARHGVVVAVLLAAVILPQAYLGYVTNVAREEVDRVFNVPAGGAWEPPTPSASGGPSASPLTTAEPSPIPAVARVNVLLLGVDSGAGRNTAGTDTMIVASLDPVTETVSMVSIPRDMVDVPLPDGSVYGPKLNGLDSDARLHPSRFPGSDGTGHDVLMSAVGTLLGLQVDYYAAVNLAGFVRVVDTLGGVDVSVTRGLCDPGYSEYGFENGFSITPGLHHLSGKDALAYARIRKAAGESDFTRAARQQELISGIRDAIVKRGFVTDPVGLLQSLGRTLQTNVPRELLPELADVMARVDRAHTYRAVIKAPLVRSGFDVRGSIQIPDVDGIRLLSAGLFPPSGTLPAREYAPPPPATSGSGSGTGNCIAPPKPSPASTVAPTPAPTPLESANPSATPESSPSESPSAVPSETPAPTLSPSPI